MKRMKLAALPNAVTCRRDLQTGWAVHKPRNEAVHFPTEVKQYLTTKFDLRERTGIKTDPAKVAPDM